MDIVDIGLIGSYVLIALCAVAAIVIPLIQSFSDPKSLVKSAIGVGVLVVIFFVGYGLADGVTSADTTESTARLTGAGLITTYVFFFVAIGGIVFTEISKMIK